MRTPSNRIATHPGVFLGEELEERKRTQTWLAEQMDVSLTYVNDIVRGKRGVSINSALKLEKIFGTSAEFWLNLQLAHDLSSVRAEMEGA
jgi:addiction module HigA family antidote